MTFCVGLIPDWNVGLNNLQCDNRTPALGIPLHDTSAGRLVQERIILHAEGLIMPVLCWLTAPGGRIRGMLIPHEFDLTDALQGGEHRPSLVFTGAPDEQGQIGYTSRSRFFKSRFNYGWDWCVRLVPLGIWDNLWLMTASDVRLHACLPDARYDASSREGSLAFRIQVRSYEPRQLGLRVEIRDGDSLLHQVVLPCSFGAGLSETVVALPGRLPVEPWWPAGMGAQKLYALSVTLEADGGFALDTWCGRVGFRQIRWLPCEGAPANAEPWICEVNGTPLFLQGANWVPIRMTYGSVTAPMYHKLLTTYVGLGFNLLRVWGGYPEKQAFYDIRRTRVVGLAGVSPVFKRHEMPPHVPEAMADLARIARSYIWRRGGHASLLCWCGGNELFYEKGLAKAKPVDASDPCIAILAGISAELAPCTRFLASSPSGPSMWFNASQAGQGMHHDIHPWMVPDSMKAWRELGR